MCLILAAWQAHPDYPLVVAANRDEFFARPTAPAGFWSDAPDILAGRDQEAGGTWLGVSLQGRFAALTNYRDPVRNQADAPSRGLLVSGFLRDTRPVRDCVRELERDAGRYNGFNLMLGDRDGLWCFSNCGEGVREMTPGVYGLSNHLLDTPWPKVSRGKSALAVAMNALPDEEPLFAMLSDERIAPDEALPRTGVSLEWERLLSAAFVRSPTYGTRSSTVVLLDRTGTLRFTEQTYLPDALAGSRGEFSFRISG